MIEKFTYFYGKETSFSQWTISNFVIDGIIYNCTEQWMMTEKARLFGDMETLSLIMEAKSPREQKRLGREVNVMRI